MLERVSEELVGGRGSALRLASAAQRRHLRLPFVGLVSSVGRTEGSSPRRLILVLATVAVAVFESASTTMSLAVVVAAVL